MDTSTVYVLTDENDVIRYVGKTTRMTLAYRLSRHLSDARKGIKNHKCNWLRSMLKRGFIPTIKPLEIVDGDGCKEEVKWIKFYKDSGVNLVNGTNGGEGSLGRAVPQSTIDAVRAAHLGIPLTPEHRRHISLGGLGKIISAEQRVKISLARKNSPKVKADALARRGVPFSDEHRKRMSIARKGMKFSQEHKRNLSLAWNARRARQAPMPLP